MTPELAKQRFQSLSLLRLAGIALMVVGFFLWKTALLGVTLPHTGAVCVVAGAAMSLILPRVLLARWRGR
jgi:predicted exporter